MTAAFKASQDCFRKLRNKKANDIAVLKGIFQETYITCLCPTRLLLNKLQALAQANVDRCSLKKLNLNSLINQGKSFLRKTF